MTEWIPIRYEERGAIQNKIWVTNGIYDTLFKPDSEKNESRIEYEVYSIAKQLGIDRNYRAFWQSRYLKL